MTFDLRSADLRKLNSLTKYPSIETYHALDPKTGGLLNEVTEFAGPVFAYEKIDGVNVRVILLPDGTYLIGSREDLLTAKGDLVWPDAHDIVNTMRSAAERLAAMPRERIICLYFEAYGSRAINAWKQYGQGEAAYRLFDVSNAPLDMLDMDVEDIALWRTRGGQAFLSEHALGRFAQAAQLEMAPHLFEMDGTDLPASVDDMVAFMEPYAKTRAATSGGEGLSEGLVLRSADRSVIAKARFKNYARTLGLRVEAERLARKAAAR